MLRFPHRLTRPSSLLTRGTCSSHALHRNFVPARLASGQTYCYCVSIPSGLPSPSSTRRRRDVCSGCIQVGGVSNSFDGALPLKNVLVRKNGDVMWPKAGGRWFCSTGNNDENGEAGAWDEKNQQIILHAESGDIAKAEELLDQMQAEALSRNTLDGMDVGSFTALMNSYIDEQKRLKSDLKDERDEIETESNAAQNNGVSMAGTIMSLAEKTQNLLIQMEDLSGVSDQFSSMGLLGSMPTGLRNASLRPTSHHYDSIISAFANAATFAQDTNYFSPLTKNAPSIAQRWLQRMETIAFDPLSGVTPTVDSYFHVMEACAASGNTTNNKHCKAPILAQSVFEKLQGNTNVYPTAREYRLMIRVWCGRRHKQGAYRAMGLWMIMAREFMGGVDEMEPTFEDGKMVLEAWTRAINKHSARRAQTLLATMTKLHASKKTAVQPDLDCYRYVLITMSRSRVPTVGSKIPKLLKSMEDNGIFPDTLCFDAAIKTLKNCARHSKSDDSDKYARATESMLLRMEGQRERSSESIVEPTAETYTNVIQALAARKTIKAAERADELLTMIEAEYAYGEGNELMRPTRDSYVGVIHAYGNSDAKDKYQRANGVLQRMIAQHSRGNEAARPDIWSFHALIGACSRTVETASSPEKQKEALFLAISTVQHMKKSEFHRPNAKSYLLLLQCCANLLPPGSAEREKALRSIFRSCRKDGLVNRQVLKQFQSTVSAEAYHVEVVKDAPTFGDVKILPEKWTRNLGYRPRMQSGTEGDGRVTQKRNSIISVGGEVFGSMAYNDHRMKTRWEKKGQKVLQGGRD